MTEIGNTLDEPWIYTPLRRLRDCGTFNKIKMFLGQGHDCSADKKREKKMCRNMETHSPSFPGSYPRERSLAKLRPRVERATRL